MKKLVIMLAIAGVGAAQAQTADQLSYVCKGFVEKRLDDPNSAQLDWTNATVVRDKKPDQYKVSFDGRAKNAYGALVRRTFHCVIRAEGKDSFRGVLVWAD